MQLLLSLRKTRRSLCADFRWNFPQENGALGEPLGQVKNSRPCSQTSELPTAPPEPGETGGSPGEVCIGNIGSIILVLSLHLCEAFGGPPHVVAALAGYTLLRHILTSHR